MLLKGGSGLGKTLIAHNLAQTALAAGFTVGFTTLAAALADLLGQESMPAFERRLRRLPCDSRAADMLYNIISRRHEQRSTIIRVRDRRQEQQPVAPRRVADVRRRHPEPEAEVFLIPERLLDREAPPVQLHDFAGHSICEGRREAPRLLHLLRVDEHDRRHRGPAVDSPLFALNAARTGASVNAWSDP